MRTIAAAIVVAAVIIVVGLRPGDTPGSRSVQDVVWSDEEPYCPHCRTDVNWYASVCYTCSHEFTWVPDAVECGTCIDAVRLRRFAKGLEDRDGLREFLRSGVEAYGLPPDVVAATVPDLVLYVESMKVGACGFCAGTGRRVAPATVEVLVEDGDSLFAYAIEQLADKCPVCLGTGRCIACGGDRTVEHGREDASLGIENLHRLISELDPELNREQAERHFRHTKEFIDRFTGAYELTDLSSLYSSSHDQTDLARIRLETVLEALPEVD